MIDPSHDLLLMVLVLHAASTWLMTGLIWFVQVVHYPLLCSIPVASRVAYLHAHQARTTLVVAPTMLIEAGTACMLLVWAVVPVDAHVTVASPALILTGGALLAAVWLSTFAVQVPIHARLLKTPSDALVERLIMSNWSRTVLWSARGGIAAWLLLGAASFA